MQHALNNFIVRRKFLRMHGMLCLLMLCSTLSRLTQVDARANAFLSASWLSRYWFMKFSAVLLFEFSSYRSVLRLSTQLVCCPTVSCGHPGQLLRQRLCSYRWISMYQAAWQLPIKFPTTISGNKPLQPNSIPQCMHGKAAQFIINSYVPDALSSCFV